MTTKTKPSREWIKQQKKLAAQFKLSMEDLHNLLDIYYIVDDQQLYHTLRINHLDKWFYKFFNRIEKICFREETK